MDRAPEAIIALAGDPSSWQKSDWIGGGGEAYYAPSCDGWLKCGVHGLDRYARVIRFLEGKVNAPRLLCFAAADGRDYLLMSNVRGESLISPDWLANPYRLVRTLAQALRVLHAIDIRDCQIRGAAERIMADCAEADRVWLLENRPTFDSVFTHGDACLPNLVCDGDSIGYIDLADGGVGDRWQDLALALWSLQHNLKTKAYGRALLDEYGISPDEVKIRYYLRLNGMDTLDVL